MKSIWLFPLFAFLVVLMVRLFIPRNAGTETNYRKRSRVLSSAERSFYGVLKQAAGPQYEVFPKVRVADVLTPEKGLGRSAWQRSFNRIAGKHFDFVLCNGQDLTVELVIELNDQSHNSKQRTRRDEFLKRATESAALPLVSFAAKNSYSIPDVRKALFTKEPLGDASA